MDAKLADIPTLDPRGAMALALRELLLGAVFRRYGGLEGPKDFQLRAVNEDWPEPDVALQYPCATVLDSAGSQIVPHNLSNTILEDTHEVFGAGTVLMKSGELTNDFQVDVWANDSETRTAIAARLPSLFAPGEGRSSVILPGSDRYYRRDVRAYLVAWKNVDQENSVYPRERRLQVTVRCNVDVVQLRCVRELDVRLYCYVADGRCTFPE